MTTRIILLPLQNLRILLAMAFALGMGHSANAANDSYVEKLSHTPIFPMQNLLWVGPNPPSEAESGELWEAFGVGHNKSFDEAVNGIEAFIKSHPDSPWVPSLETDLGVYQRQNGYFTSALNDWQAAWEATRQKADPKSHLVADYALVNMLQLLCTLGRTDELKELFDETAQRQISSTYDNRYRRAQAAYGVMLSRPEICYRCGTYALDAVAQTLFETNLFKQIGQQPSPPTGFSMADLMKLSDEYHLNLTAVERPAGDELVVPSVVHWKENHYAAIVAQKGDLYKVVDPTFRFSRWLKADAINTECSGQFMVPANQVPNGWRTLSRVETAKIFGKGIYNYPDGPPCAPDSSDSSSGGSSGGNAGGSTGPIGQLSESSSSSGGSSGGSSSGGDSGGSCSKCGDGPGGQGSAGGSGGSGGCGKCVAGLFAGNVATGGMPRWTVPEPWCTLWIADEPLGYKPAKGPRVSFKLRYWVEGADYWQNFDEANNAFFGLTPNWNCSWLSYIAPPEDGSDGVTLFDGGGERDYTNFDGTVPEFSTRTRMLVETNSSGSITGYQILYPNGAINIYTNIYVPEIYAPNFYFLSQQIGPDGNSTTYIYTNSPGYYMLLECVIDGDGRTNSFTYTNVTDAFGTTTSNLISQISDPFGNSVQFAYGCVTNIGVYGGPDAELTNITDVMGISSSFVYDNLGDYAITQMCTPYGPTTFDYDSPDSDQQYMIVTEPNGSHQMCLFLPGVNALYHEEQAIPQVYTDSRYVPTSRPSDLPGGGNTLDNPDWINPAADDGMSWYNSFYWNRQQFANLSTNFLATGPNWDLNQLTTNDFFLPRMRHWNSNPTYNVYNNLSMEREPSPDNGQTLGEMTWYDYPNKPDYNIDGSSDTPILTIKVLPDGTEWYQINQLDQWNNATNVITTYSVNGTVLTRTNFYVYAANGQDLLKSIGPDGVTNAAYGYDSSHQVLFLTNALGEVTSNTFNADEQLTCITQPNGQVTTNLYGADGHVAQQIVIGISTNTFTWINDLICTYTDARGLTITNAWDSLNRLTNVLYPDGSFVSYNYSNCLDLVKVVDRMGNPTTYTYNQIRQKTSQTDARGNTTLYDYCECGALYSITDALDNVTYLIHDNQGNLVQTMYPDGYSITNTYNLLHQLVTRSDSSGMSVSNWYNNQGLLIVSSNNVGRIRALAYDIKDRTTNTIDANNVSVGMSYDNLNRPLLRRYPDTGIESYGYTPDLPGPTSYTNQISKVWLYGYDSIYRKTNEVCVGITANGFAYNGAGDLLTLTDGNGNTTTWGYDQYGRVTNKLDAVQNVIFKYGYDDNNRLTNRWTPAKGNTVYSYDSNGNLTKVTYHVSPPINFTYDADNRLTNMLDGIGTTAYGYNQVGQLLSAGGLWPNDTVSYTYQNRLLIQASLAHSTGSPWTNDYEYDEARRLTNVESVAGTFNYIYDPMKLQRVDELGMPNGAYITNSYDSVARLLSTALFTSNGTNLDSQNYTYNTAAQRTSETNVAGDYRTYTYNAEGELTKALGFEANGSTRSVDEFLYHYDGAGNMMFKEPGYNPYGEINYSINNLNQITNATVGSVNFDGQNCSNQVSGSTTSPATNVTVNGITATLYADNSFYAIPLNITNGPNIYTAIAENTNGFFSTNSATETAILTNTAYVYDTNGNMLCDGFKTFAYDDENELISVCLSNSWSNSFAYDGKMRRRIERDYTWNGSAWTQTNEIHYIYDGNVVIEERNANNAPLVSYSRGNDMSGTFQGAGGIGGLLARMTYGQELPGAPTTAFYHADGNGNITALMYPSQQLAAKYLYDPFGNMLSMWGPLMNYNEYRFSSKEWNGNSGLYYYLYRFYDPNLQRWPNRDPLGNSGIVTERVYFSGDDTRIISLLHFQRSRLHPYSPYGFLEFVRPVETLSDGPNLYEFSRNAPENLYDSYGENCSDPCRAAACAAASAAACAPLFLVPPPQLVGRILGTSCVASLMAYCCSDNPPPFFPPGDPNDPINGPYYNPYPL